MGLEPEPLDIPDREEAATGERPAPEEYATMPAPLEPDGNDLLLAKHHPSTRPWRHPRDRERGGGDAD